MHLVGFIVRKVFFDVPLTSTNRGEGRREFKSVDCADICIDHHKIRVHSGSMGCAV